MPVQPRPRRFGKLCESSLHKIARARYQYQIQYKQYLLKLTPRRILWWYGKDISFFGGGSHVKQLLFGFLAFGLAVFSLHAAPTIINSGTGGVNTGVNGTFTPGGPAPGGAVANTPVGLVSGWSAALGTSSWVSFTSNNTPTPPDQSPCGGASICNNDYVSFYHDFTLAGSTFTGSTLDVMADDTAGVYINGHQLWAANGPYNAITNSYTTCSNIPVGCLNPLTLGHADISTWLRSGTNSLVFEVFQRNGAGFGLDYSASVVPEPGFYGVLALGLSGLCLAISRRKRSA